MTTGRINQVTANRENDAVDTATLPASHEVFAKASPMPLFHCRNGSAGGFSPCACAACCHPAFLRCLGLSSAVKRTEDDHKHEQIFACPMFCSIRAPGRSDDHPARSSGWCCGPLGSNIASSPKGEQSTTTCASSMLKHTRNTQLFVLREDFGCFAVARLSSHVPNLIGYHRYPIHHKRSTVLIIREDTDYNTIIHFSSDVPPLYIGRKNRRGKNETIISKRRYRLSKATPIDSL